MRRKRYFSACILVVLMGIASNGFAHTRTDEGNPGLLSLTVKDQKAVAITIYNVNLGLVKDEREIGLPSGTRELRFMDVASQIIPTSVSIRSLIDPESLQVLEQNYEYDLLNPQKLLDKYVGKEVKLYYKNFYTEREEIVTATLLSNNGSPIFRIGDEITFGYPGRIIFPKVPDSLISKPTLVWLVQNSLLKPQNIETSYLTNGINWQADYVVILNEEDNRADLSSWVTINNKSGTTYRNAKLKLVAGDIHRVRDEREYKDKMLRAAMKEARPAEPQFKQEEFFEYHIYTLQRPATIKQNQTKQICLVSADRIPVKKELLYYGARFYYRSRNGGKISNQKVGVFIEVENKEEHNLGIPLPRGTMRVYKHDKEGSLQFVGEDITDHTPKDEKVRVKLGDAFDVVGSRIQTDWRKIAYDTYEVGIEVSLRNHKKEDVSNVHVPRDGETKLQYRVRMRF
jgi:hypothetical protein